MLPKYFQAAILVAVLAPLNIHATYVHDPSTMNNYQQTDGDSDIPASSRANFSFIKLLRTVLPDQDPAAVKSYVRELMANRDFEQLSQLLKKARQKEKQDFMQRCLDRFKSRSVCVTQTSSFFIWQNLQARKMMMEQYQKHATKTLTPPSAPALNNPS